jgi:hypothetical protein
VTSSEIVGKSTIRVEFKYDGVSMAKGGRGEMFLDDEQVANGRVDETIFVLLVRRRDFRYRLTSQ